MKHIIKVEVLQNLPNIRPLIAMDNNGNLVQLSDTPGPTPVGPPADEIWYTTNDGQRISLDNDRYFYDINGNILTYTNTYENDKGILKFNDNVAIIGSATLIGNETLTSITLPNGLIKIEYDGCANLSNLENINIPKSVVTLDFETFRGIGENIKQEEGHCHIIFESSTPLSLIDEYNNVIQIFGDTGSSPMNAKIYVPQASLKEYKNHDEGWEAIAQYIVGYTPAE